MNEREFLTKLQQRAKEQEKIMNAPLFPGILKTVSIWLGNHPWRILIPLAFLLTIIFYSGFGNSYGNLILRIFGGPQ